MMPLADPQFLPFQLDLIARRVALVRFDAGLRREAAFLDERAMRSDTQGTWVPMDMLLREADGFAPGARPADAIFHIGHCGSTLLSRLLESWGGVEALREPQPLRTLAQAWPELGRADSRLSPQEATRLLEALWAWWSRPLAPQGRALVKASSSCNVLIAPLLRACPDARALLLDMPLRPYLATLLKNPGSVRDAAVAAGERLLFLQSHGIATDSALHAMSLPVQCAMGWLAERVRFATLSRVHPERLLRVDFERLLAEPAPVLARISEHLGLAREGVEPALRSAAWARYSKLQDHAYGADDRAHDLALAQQRHAVEIADGERWVEDALRRHGALRALACLPPE